MLLLLAPTALDGSPLPEDPPRGSFRADPGHARLDRVTSAPTFLEQGS